MENSNNSQLLTKNIIEIAIKIVILGVMIIISFQLIKPFLLPVLWGMILAVAVEPYFARFAKLIGNRRSLAAVIFVLGVFTVLVIPTVQLALSSVGVVQEISMRMHDKTLVIPLPPAKVAEWPLVGESFYETWSLFATNLEEALKQFAPQIKAVAGTVLGSVGSGLVSILIVLISTIIAGVFLAKADQSATVIRKVIVRVVGESGVELASLATATIRGVMLGVVGVALLQAIFSAIGMVVVGVPASGLWAALVLVLAVCQLSPILVLGPVAAYVFTVSETTSAVIFLIWVLFICTSDNFLKPLLMGRGVNIPMLVILIGALGGLLLSGIIGLFLGPVILAIMYTLCMAWLDGNGEQNKITDLGN
ncbi:MAG: AI-2E family transporter [Desulfuromusa sp.]|nr:AI-2E family transporter [Desulfuromusa sp.]